MSAEKFCELCVCTSKGIFREENWLCPLIGRNICEVCCQAEVAGGMGAPDTLREICKLSERTEPEVHAACVACVHGGPQLNEPPKALYVKPGAEEQNDHFIENWKSRLDWLNGNRKGNETDDLS